MRPDLDALEALIAVVQHGSFARAATELHKAQSAISYQVRKLEDQLGVGLLDRDGYRVRLTTAGEAVVAEGRRLLAHAEQLAAVADQFARGWEPRLTLIVDGILPLEPILHALKALAGQRVPTRVQVRVEFLGGVQTHFEQDRAELMLVKEYQPRAGLEAEALAPMDVILCAARAHSLAKSDCVALSDLHEHVELSVQDSSARTASNLMFGGERVFHLSGFEAKKQALLMGVGFGWMPRYLVAAELAAGDLCEVRYSGGSRYRFSPLLVHRLDTPLGRTGRALVDMLKAAAPFAPVREGGGRQLPG